MGRARWIARWFAECRLREEQTRERERARAARLPISLSAAAKLNSVYSPGNYSAAMLIERTNEREQSLERTKVGEFGDGREGKADICACSPIPFPSRNAILLTH